MKTGLGLMFAVLAAAGCGGRVGSMHVRALARYGDRDVTLAPPFGGDPSGGALQDGIVAGLARGGITPTQSPRPGAFVLRTRMIRAGEEVAGGAALRSWGHTIDEHAESAVKAFQRGSHAYNESRLHLELLMWVPGREKPIGAAYWDGFRTEDEGALIRRAAEETGETMAREIAVQRERWFSRRVGDERLILTPTPNVLPSGEWVLSNDMALVFQLARSFKERFQVNVVAGALPVPVAGGVGVPVDGGVVGAVYAGVGVIGTLGAGVKVRVLDEGARWPGVSVGYDMVNVWGGALAGGGVFFLGRGVAGAGAVTGAAYNLQFNLLTASASKHFGDWLQLGTGLYVVDNHHFLPQSDDLLVASTSTASHSTDRFPTIGVPWLSAEAAAGNHFRFMSEYFFTPGADWYLLGLRTLFYRTRFGLARTGHLAMKLDTSLMFTKLRHEDGSQHAIVLPWLGVAFYLR